MTLIRLDEGRPAFGDDAWTHVADDETLPSAAPAIVSLERWLAERDALAGRNAPLGVRLKSDQRIEAIAPDLGTLSLVALDFPNLNDGRHFTTARLLRERHGFAGEVRATGQVLRDQLFFMARCGFDAFELAPGRDATAAGHAFGEFSGVYQPAADGRAPIPALRAREQHARAAAE